MKELHGEEWPYEWNPADLIGIRVRVVPLVGTAPVEQEFVGVEWDDNEMEWVAYVREDEDTGLVQGVHPSRIKVPTTVPRIWLGIEDANPAHWWWRYDLREWTYENGGRGGGRLVAKDIFVRGDAPMPTVDPTAMSSIEVCTEVDW